MYGGQRALPGRYPLSGGDCRTRLHLGCRHGCRRGADGVLGTEPGTTIEAQRLVPVSQVTALDASAVKVKLLAETGRDSRYFDRQYQLLDETGKPVRSGNYLITLSMP